MTEKHLKKARYENLYEKLLHFIAIGDIEKVKYLVEQDVINHANIESALLTAIYSYRPLYNEEMIHFLPIEELERYSSNRDIIERHNRLEIIRYLVEQGGADIHTLYEEPLKLASESGKLEIVKYLVEQGANIHRRNDIALRKASQNGYLRVVKYLVEQGANIHANNDEVFKNFLEWAKQTGNSDYVEYLKQAARYRLKKDLTKSYLAISKTSPVNLGRDVIKNISYRSIYGELCSNIKGDIPPLKLLALADILKIKYDINTSHKTLCGAVKLMLLF